MQEEEDLWTASIHRYIEHHRRRGLKPGTLVLTRVTLRRLRVFTGRAGIRDPRSFTATHMDQFVRFLRTTYQSPQCGRLLPLSPATIGDTVRAVRRFLDFLVREGDLIVHPAQGFRWRQPPRTIVDRAVRPEPIAVLIETLKKEGGLRAVRDQALLEVLFGCGLRRAEVVGLDLGDVDLATGELRIRHGKGGHERVVPIAGAARRALSQYLFEVRPELVSAASSAAVFLTRSGGRRLGIGTVRWVVETAVRRAKLSMHLTPHMLRHGYATALIRGGASIRFVQALLGHRNLETTQIYTAVDLDDLKRVHARTHPRERSR